MKNFIISIICCAFVILPTQITQAELIPFKDIVGLHLGAFEWPKVKKVAFTWTHVPTKTSRHYTWYPQKHKVIVTVKNKITTINLKNKKDQTTSAYKTFINDSYWPFFMLHATTLDTNVDVHQIPTAGESWTGGTSILKVKYGKVGLTPGDTYYVFLNDKNRDVGWKYISANKKKSFTLTREKHVTQKGITVPTVFKTQKGKTFVKITGLSIN